MAEMALKYAIMKPWSVVVVCGASLTMCGTCCMCAAMFTLDGPRVLGSSCLATGRDVDWTVTKDRTPNGRREKSSNE